MARIILLLSGAFIAALAVPMYFVLCIWVSISEEYERRKRREKGDEDEDEDDKQG